MIRRLLPLFLFGVGCVTVEPDPYTFDGPTTATVLHPDDGGPFDEPVGFVSNSRSGRITPLDLKHATLLSDQLAAPWLASRGVALGDQRQLGELMVWAPQGELVSLMAVDLAYQVLVEAPYIVSTDPELEVAEPLALEPVFEGSGGASLSGVEVRTGWTTTEQWSMLYDGTSWWVSGSRSGRQTLPATTGIPYRSDNYEIAFTIEGIPESGDRILLDTDSGVVEHDLGAVPLTLRRVPGHDLALVGTWDPLDDSGAIVLWDLQAQAEAGRVELGSGVQPWEIEIAWAEDGQALAFVGDASLPAVYRMLVDLETGSLLEGEQIDTAGPVQDLAWLAGVSAEGTAWERLYVASAGTNRVDIVDLESMEWVDVNPFDGVDAAGLDLFAPVVGLAAAPDPVRVQTAARWGVYEEAWVVVLTLFDGSMMMLDAETGCLITDSQGARLVEEGGDEKIEFTDRGATSTPALQIDEATGRRVTTSACGGLVRNESWRITYDGASANWTVQGAVSGEQVGRLYEDQRYVSDNGGWSIAITSGPLPATDGDEWQFTTVEGVLRLTEVSDSGSGSSTSFQLPGEPVIFQYDAGPTGGGWDELDRRTFALLPLTGNDLVLRVWLRTWNVEVVWD